MAFVWILTLLLGASGAQANSQHSQLKQQIDKALNIYSSAMGVKLYQKDSLLSEQVHNLIVERKLFYARYFQLGLHSKLFKYFNKF